MTTKQATKLSNEALYERDYSLWLEKQVQALENRDVATLDFTNLAEEVGDLAKRGGKLQSVNKKGLQAVS